MNLIIEMPTHPTWTVSVLLSPMKKTQIHIGLPGDEATNICSLTKASIAFVELQRVLFNSLRKKTETGQNNRWRETHSLMVVFRRPGFYRLVELWVAIEFQKEGTELDVWEFRAESKSCWQIAGPRQLPPTSTNPSQPQWE